jgi:hypothetical protein
VKVVDVTNHQSASLLEKAEKHQMKQEKEKGIKKVRGGEE